MMKQISDWLIRISSNLLMISVTLILLLFIFLFLPGKQGIEKPDGTSVMIPDILFHYTPEQLYETAGNLGKTGRSAYIRMHRRFDIVWPMVYGGFLSVSISWAGTKTSRIKKNTKTIPDFLLRLNIIPLTAVLFDFLENMLTSAVMRHYPEYRGCITLMAPTATMLKWILIYFSILILVTYILVWGFRLFTRRHKNSSRRY